MANRLRVLAAVALFSSLSANSASAQGTVSAQPPALTWDIAPADAAAVAASQAPPNLAYVEGSVDVVQDGTTEPAEPPHMLLDGAIVRTRDGRAEIVFGDGTLLHLGAGSELEILDDQHLRLVTGRAIVRVSSSAPRAFVIDTPLSAVTLTAQGEYGVSTDPTPRLDVTVTRGTATIGEPTPWTIRGAQMLTIEGPGGRPLIQSFNSARFDAFQLWSYDRANAFASSASSSQLPSELRPYGSTFDSYGQWEYMTPYGYVWYPAVDSNWRPYHDGSWGFTKYGWTWYGRERWAWPTHHYGRWGFKGNSWYWIPDRIWGPGWVSWSVAAGFVSWAPLGLDYHPAIGLFPAIDHPAYRPNYGPGRAWTFIRREHFVPRRQVTPYAVGFDRLDDPTRRALADSVVSPPVNNVAVPRGSVAGSRVPGSVRRPPVRSYPSNGAINPGAPQLPASVGSSRGLATSPGDDPAYAPRYWNVAGDPAPRPRPADARRPDGGDDVIGPADAPRDPYGRSNGRANDPRSRYWNSGGDGRRGGGDGPRAVPRSDPPGGTRQRGSGAGAPPPSPPSGGGAVERGGSRPAPRTGAPSGRSGGASSAGAPSGRSGGGGTAGAPAAAPPARGGARRP
jgi:hypothetical protein